MEENCGVKKIGGANEMGVDLRQMGFLSAGFQECNQVFLCFFFCSV